MNSSFWKMGRAKNRPLLLLLLFVPGSSRASVRSTATDDREVLTFPLPLLVLLIHLGCSPCTQSCSTSVYTDIQPFTLGSQFIFYFAKAFCAWPSLVVLHCTSQGSVVSQTVLHWHIYHQISVVMKFLEVALFICLSIVTSTAEFPMLLCYNLDLPKRKIKTTNICLSVNSKTDKTSLASNFKTFSSVEIFILSSVTNISD